MVIITVAVLAIVSLDTNYIVKLLAATLADGMTCLLMNVLTKKRLYE